MCCGNMSRYGLQTQRNHAIQEDATATARHTEIPIMVESLTDYILCYSTAFFSGFFTALGMVGLYKKVKDSHETNRRL